ncbi:Retinoic acid induced 16-like protein-domain-containing protein [Russula vinacea]|nr:Retinoic acid induced 16-like protein-domain-containing protein [Russula vinacea]
MDYFSKFLRSGNHATEFHRSWTLVESTLLHPDERQLSRGITSTDVSANLKMMVDLLVRESTRTEEGGTGVCLEYLLKNDVLGKLVRLSETDRPSGIQVEVLRAVQNMVILLDEQFLVHSAVHKAVLRLLRNCVGDEIQEQLDNRNRKAMGAAKNIVRSSPSEYEEDLVNLLCILCSRIRTFRELLMIFFHDKHGYPSDTLFSVEEEEEEEEDDGSDDSSDTGPETSPGSEGTEKPKKSEYEFLLFNYLLRFVHREGQIGDFARAGLLFLMDVALSPGDQVHRLSKDDPNVATADPIADAALSLAEYILDGDFSDVLGLVLGPSTRNFLPNSRCTHPPSPGKKSSSMVLGGGPYGGFTDRDFKTRLDHFLKLVEFLEDIFRRNVPKDNPDTGLDPSALVGTAVVDSILAAIAKHSSKTSYIHADGSAVAVMSYIEVMIRTLERGQLTDLLVNFLVSEDNDDVPKPQPWPHSTLTLGSSVPGKTHNTETQAKLRRRRSSAMMLLELEAPVSKQSGYFTSLGRFTLKDLLISNLRSKDQPTAAAALQLLNVLLFYYSPLCVDKLLVVIRDPLATSFPEPTLNDKPHATPFDQVEDEVFVYPSEELDASVPPPSFAQPRTTYSAHEREMDLYLKLVSRLDPMQSSNSFSTGYDRYLCDAIQAIQNHSSFSLDVSQETRAHMKHRLNPNDPILSAVLEWLRKLFSNSPEFNIALTGLLASLARDPFRSLAGWLNFGHAEDASGTTQPLAGSLGPVTPEDGDDRSADFQIEEMLTSESRTPTSNLDDASRPVILTIFQSLVAQLDRYRQSIANFDKYLLERRQGLLFSENLTDALTLALDLEDTSGPLIFQSPVTVAPPVSESPPKSVSKMSAGSFVSFLTPRKSKPPSKTAQSGAISVPTSSRTVAARPFGSHYQHTSAVAVEPFEAPSPSEGPWTPARPLKFSAEEEDVFSSGWEDRPRNTANSGSQLEEAVQGPKTVTLSRLLDNIVILEESIKEMAAIIQARRALGIDAVRYI